MTFLISELINKNGEQLVNVPADSRVLIDLGFSPEEARALIAAAIHAETLERALDARRVAYAADSDPLYMEWQYDQTPESEKAWRDKVAEIKARYPLPAE
ncbi:hypothetical protein AAE147_005982 [Pseudomonas aeruginosa]